MLLPVASSKRTWYQECKIRPVVEGDGASVVAQWSGLASPACDEGPPARITGGSVCCNLSAGCRLHLWRCICRLLRHEGVFVPDESMRVQLERLAHELGDSTRCQLTLGTWIRWTLTPKRRPRQSYCPTVARRWSSTFAQTHLPTRRRRGCEVSDTSSSLLQLQAPHRAPPSTTTS